MTERQIHLAKCEKDGAVLVSVEDHYKHCHFVPYVVSETEFKAIQKARREANKARHEEFVKDWNERAAKARGETQ